LTYAASLNEPTACQTGGTGTLVASASGSLTLPIEGDFWLNADGTVAVTFVPVPEGKVVMGSATQCGVPVAFPFGLAWGGCSGTLVKGHADTSRPWTFTGNGGYTGTVMCSIDGA
jgi:hypothetical protein